MNVVQTERSPQPFTRELDRVACYEYRGHQEAFARLKLMVEQQALGVLTGEVGSGKSTLIRRLFRSYDAMTHLPIYLSIAGLKPRDFYGELLRHVGEEPLYSVTKAKRQWEDVLAGRQAHGEKQLVVVIDEAQEMSEAMMLELRFVMNHQMDACSLFPLILVGQPELRKQLRLKKYEAIAQRIGMQFHLQGMTKEETEAYIRHHIKTACLSSPVFSETAMHLVHTASQGLPRVINQICRHVLHDAAGKQHEVVEEIHITRVLADMDRQRGATG
ncbi:ExeA family protein [Paenibacillus alba]|uniref:AAA family ATPase n=1 Tax=Paenibacillus alba TaxID=1197127 RepID=A0ABU6G6F8_9BACL|nr:AAA family ATPase [Paenibacillus alba]MEC0229763.1 AAA family ATPase [Paenibacillus alba]